MGERGRFFLLLFLTTLAAAALILLVRPAPILIGFAGQLQGGRSDLGVHGRNGARLAVEEINHAGGVAGRPLKLLVRDDADTPEGAVAADKSLLEAGVVAVIGHMTSSQTLAALEFAVPNDLILISPTTSTPLLAEQHDVFFQVIGVNTGWAEDTAKHLVDKGKLRIGIVADISNTGYTDTFNNAFRETFRKLDGNVPWEVGFTSGPGVTDAWEGVVAAMEVVPVDGILATTSARDLASLARYLRGRGLEVDLSGTTWASTQSLLQEGGASVEGISFVSSYVGDNRREEFRGFRERYRERFGWFPNFAAAFAYESVLVLARALEATGGEREGLRQHLAPTPELAGIVSAFRLDEFGDAKRPDFIVAVRDGRFVSQGMIR